MVRRIRLCRRFYLKLQPRTFTFFDITHMRRVHGMVEMRMRTILARVPDSIGLRILARGDRPERRRACAWVWGVWHFESSSPVDRVCAA